MLSPLSENSNTISFSFWKASPELNKTVSDTQGNTCFLSPQDYPSWVSRKLNGSQLKLSFLLWMYTCIFVYSHRSMLPLPTCTVFGISLTPYCLLCPHRHQGMYQWSLSLPDLHLPWSGKASTVLLATLISKTEGLTLLASQWDSSWSFSFLLLQCLSLSSKTCFVLCSSWLFP